MEIKENFLTNIGETIRSKENLYAPIATKNSQYLRKKQHKYEEPIIRPPFYRDADRIIHSRAYARYIDKTQVFFLVDNDHVTHRVLHVQLVSKIARTIGRSLSLNEDLIEAISLGHDIGHVPYGHFGEKILSDLCEKNGIGKFLHNVQSIQFLDVIEDCDLTIQVLDGILCHNGEVHGKTLKPYGDVNWEAFQSKIEGIKAEKDFCPMTIEGCIVRIADTIAYLGRDLQDALEVNIIQDLSDFPQNCTDLFGLNDEKNINWAVVNTLIKDVINTSFGKNTISFSDDVSECVHDFYEFNKKNIYLNSILLKESEKVKHMYVTVFNQSLKDLESENKESFIYPDMINLDWIAPEYFEDASSAEIVRDYIAGMTDRYFEFVFSKITIPDRVKRKYK